MTPPGSERRISARPPSGLAHPVTRALGALGLFALAAAGRPGALTGQLPIGRASTLALGDHVTATARRADAIAVNPAALAFGERTLEIGLLPVRIEAGLDPVSLGDLADWNGRAVPRRVREEWLERIVSEGGQTGFVGAEVTGLSVAWRRFGFQLSTVATGRLDLNPDAGELVLFGNAGLTGEPRTFEFGGSSLDGFVVSTAAFAFGSEVATVRGGRLSLGSTLKVVVGNALVVARDEGSFADPDPVEIEVELPVLSNPSNGGGIEHGTGLGIDVGAAWERADLRLGVAIRNVLNTFGWILDDLVFRPGTGLIDQEDSTTDFDERPSEQAPQQLREAVIDLGFGPELAVGAGLSLTPSVSLATDFWIRSDEGMAPGPDWRIGAGTEYRPVERLGLRSHLSLIEDGVRFGAGAGIFVGPVRLDGSVAYRVFGASRSTLASLGLSFGSF